MEQLFWLTCLCHVYKTVAKMTPAWSKMVFPPIDLRTYYTCLSPTGSQFQVLVVLILYFPRMDDPAVSQHVCDHMITLRHVLFLSHVEESRIQCPSHFQSGRYYQLGWCIQIIFQDIGEAPFFANFTYHFSKPIFNIQFTEVDWVTR